MKQELRNRFQAGQALRYRASTVARQVMGPDSAPAQHEWRAVLVQQVVAVEGDGTAHIVTRAALEDPNPAATEAALEAQKTAAYNKVDARGFIMLSSSPVPSPTYTLAAQAVEPGDEWTETTLYPLPPSGQPAPIQFRYRYLRDEPVEGRTCAIVEVGAASSEWEVTLPGSQEPALMAITIEGSFAFDIAAGLLVRLEVTTATSPRVGGQVVRTETKMTQMLERVDVLAAV